MRKIIFAITAVSILAAVSCKKKNNDPDPVTPVTPTEDTLGYELSGDITSDRTLWAGKTYTISAMIYVKNNATLTIGKGATIKAIKGKNGIVVTRGAKLMAVGTVDSPIVFTSNEGTPAAGDWGGIVLLGKATTNATFNSVPGQGEIEGGVNNSAGDGIYGGTDDNDNSGKLKYVRIEYAGYPFQPDKELNSLTMGAVGRGTEIDYVQCSYGYDDAFEWFGGTVNCSHLISYKTHDDNFDADFGFRGNVQFGIAITDPADADISGSNGFEVDNDATGSDNTPFTAPTFANMTIIGPKETSTTTVNTNYKRAAHVRRNSRPAIINSVLLGFPSAGILLDGSKCANNMSSGAIEFKGVTVGGISKAFDTVGTSSTSLGSLNTFLTTTNPSWNNASVTNTSDAGLSAAYASGASFNPNPNSGSVLTTGVVSTGRLGSFFSTVSYRGACSVGDTWWKSWTKF
ncbi:hypothetical protein GCM10023093_11010 [Nemorincola caseinilytica]|uniref:T9SS C-terminal target domain-containing protein n=1 Tax=Nemorincola caseinilytica TaxID=2054315 RepID=A0ABP8NBQ7_9BACT